VSGRTRPLLLGRLRGFGARSAKQRAAELLDVFDLHAAEQRQAKAYSGGMRRRLDIAASLITTPRLLFLDRPASSPTDPRACKGGNRGARDLRHFAKVLVETLLHTVPCRRVRPDAVSLGHAWVTSCARAAPRRSARRAGRCAAAAFAGGSGSLPSPTPGPPGCGSTTFGAPPPHSRRPAAQACAPMARIGHASAAAAALRLRGTGRARRSGRRSRAVKLVRTPLADSITSIGSG
jgi:hypothetical protein